MSLKHKIILSRVCFIIIALMLLAAFIILFNILSDSSNYNPPQLYNEPSVNTEAVDNSISITEPSFSYNMISLNFCGTITPGTLLGSESFGTFNSYLKENGPGCFLSKLAEMFKNDDYTFSICGGVLSDNLDLFPGNDETLRYALGFTSNAQVFTKGGIDVVSATSLFINDYGEDGKKDTYKALENAGLTVIDSSTPMIIEKYGVKIAVFATSIGAEANQLYELIDNEHDNYDYIIVYVTDTIRAYTPTTEKKLMMRTFIDVGANMVIGSNGFLLQPIEEYEDGIILYSLGSLVDGLSKYLEQHSAILNVSFNIDEQKISKTNYKITPVVTYDDISPWQPEVISDVELYTRVSSFINGERESIEQ